MNYSVEGTTLILSVSGHVDTSNAEAVEAEINALCQNNPHTALMLDAHDLEYISSAGLRVVLRLKKTERDFKVINVSSAVFEIFEMTGFSEMMTIERARRELSVDGCTVIGQGAKGTVYRWNADTIVKVYKDRDSLDAIERERNLARKAFILGVPTAIPYDIVTVGDKFGSVFELLDAKSYSELIKENPDKMNDYVKVFADLLGVIHSTPVKDEDMPDYKGKIREWLRDVKEYLPTEETERLSSMVEAVPDPHTMLHCDYHTNNIMEQNGEALLIDMDTLSHGHPIYELANIHIAYVGFGLVKPAIVENFLGLSYDTALSFWNRFEEYYYNNNLKEQKAAGLTFEELHNKIELLSMVRLLRHTVRRGVSDEDGRRTVDLCRERIADLLGQVESLAF